MNYSILVNNRFQDKSYELLSLRREDIYSIKAWRNAQMKVLRQKRVLTDGDQKKYYDTVIAPSYTEPEPEQILFSYLQASECIGYGGLVNVAWEDRRAEVSFLLNPQLTQDDSQYQLLFSIFLKMLKSCAFEVLKFNRLFTETFDLRPTHITTLEENGFIFEGRLKGHVLIEGACVDSLIHGCINPK